MTDPIPLVHMGSAAEYGLQPEGDRHRRDRRRPTGGRLRADQAGGHRAGHRPGGAGSDPGHGASGVQPGGPAGPRQLPGRHRRPRDQAGACDPTVVRSPSARSGLLPGLPGQCRCRGHRQPSGRSRTVDDHPILNVGRGVAMSCRSMVELLAAAAGFEGDVFETAGGSRALGRRCRGSRPMSPCSGSISIGCRPPPSPRPCRDLWQSGG